MSHFGKFSFNFFCTLFILLSAIYYGQDYSFFPETIKVTAELYNKGEYKEAMEYNVKALEKSKSANDKNSIVTININISFLLFSIHNLKESIVYIDKAKKELGEDYDPLSQARIHIEYGKNYSRLGMIDQSNINYNKAIEYSQSIENDKQKQFIQYYCYIWKRLNFLNKKDSLQSIDKKVMKIMPSGIIYSQIANDFINNKKYLDSADYYLKKATMAPDKDILAVKGMTLISYGNLYNTKQDYPKALEYYIDALKVLKQKNFRTQIRVAYDSLSSVYNYLNDTKQAKIFGEQYKKLNDSIKKEEKEATNILVNNLIKNKNDKEKKDREYIYFLIFGIIVLISISGFIIRKKRIKDQKNKDLQIKDQSIQIEKLEKKTDDAYDKVYQMAKTDDPFFLTKFKTLYPEFYAKLILQNPNLTDNDLKMCAYIKMNISNKEISIFRNVAFRSVETAKYRLKKKLGLEISDDLNEWIENL